jgi:hypothetical protein
VNSAATRRVVLLGAVAGGAAAGYFKFLRTLHMTWGATQEEVAATLPGDELIENAKVVTTRAVDIKVPPGTVWPWVVQLGPGRGGAYTYDWLERRLGVEMQNTDEILPEAQQMKVGDEFPMPGGVTFRVEIFEPDKTLAFRSTDGHWVWSFELVPVDSRTRLISRSRLDTSEYTRKQRLRESVGEPGAWYSERKTLLSIKEHAEDYAKVQPAPVPKPEDEKPAASA